MKSTKRSLLLSALSLMLCVSMLLGTTYAWFTDSVTSGKNRIVAGNLDVEMYYKNPGKTEWTNVATADSVDPKFFVDANGNDILWEPGVVAYANFKIANVGTLALKYNFKTIAKSFNTVNGKSLQDVIKFAVIENDATKYALREEALAAAAGTEFVPMVDFGYAGNLMPNGEKLFTVVAYWEPNVLNDDDYNLKNGLTSSDGEPLYIDLEIQLVATQLMSEKDSFDEKYDAGAPWLGGYDAVPEEEDGVITILTAEQLAGFAKSVNGGTSYAGKTIKLGSNIDLNNLEWPGIYMGDQGKAFTFDGNGMTVYNLKVSHEGSAGLFNKATSCTIMNLTVDGASVAGTNSVAVIVGHGLCTKVENCTVKNAAIVTNPVLKDNGKYDDGDKAGAIVGYLSGEPVAYVKNCTVSDTTIAAFRDLGAFTGIANTTSEVSGNTVGENVKLAYIFVAPYDGHVNENMTDYAGRIAETATVENNHGTPAKGEANVLSSASDLVMFAAAVNGGMTFEGQNVKLDADVDLKNVAWTPIGNVNAYPSNTFAGVFDGQEHTISNLTCVDNTVNYACAGLFGSTMGVIKNLNLTNVNISSTHYAGAIVAYSSANGGMAIENCHVEGGTITSVPELIGDGYDNGDKVGGIIGYYVANGVVDGCSVKNVTISAYRDLGGIAGCTNGTIKNCAVENVVLIQDNTKGLSGNVTTVGEIWGRNNPTEENNTKNNNKIVYSKIVKVEVAENATQDEVNAAVNNAFSNVKSGNIIVLPETDKVITLPAVKNAEITIKGAGTDKTKITRVGAQGMNGEKLSISDVTLVGGTADYNGFQHTDTEYYENCKFTGKTFFYGNEVVCKNCVFEQTAYDYCFWTYGAKNITFENCTFNTIGKAAKVYNESEDGTFNVAFTNCTFNTTDDTKSKPAIAVNTLGAEFNIICNGCSADNFANGTSVEDDAMTEWYNGRMVSAPEAARKLIGCEGDLSKITVTIDGIAY